MKCTLLSLLVVGLFAGAGTSAIAQNVTAGNQPPAPPDATMKQSEKQAKPAMGEADRSTAKATFKAAKAKAHTDYKDATLKCESQKGDAMRTCVKDAKASRTEALALAQSEWDGRASAHPGSTADLPVTSGKAQMK